MSKYLSVPVDSTPKRAEGSLPRAKLLTSLDSLRMIEEKEKKKQDELELKATRKKEREEKKKVRDEEAKKRAEKRVVREQERVKKAEQKAEEKKKQEQVKRKREEDTRKRNCGGQVKRKRQCIKLHPAQAKESETGQKGEIDTNTCCICNGSYEQDVMEGTGADWLACACGRWLHEDCVDDCIRDDEGKERICPFCLDELTTKFA